MAAVVEPEAPLTSNSRVGTLNTHELAAVLWLESLAALRRVTVNKCKQPPWRGLYLRINMRSYAKRGSALGALGIVTRVLQRGVPSEGQTAWLQTDTRLHVSCGLTMGLVGMDRGLTRLS
jgi:hypothetical protein